MDFKEYKIQASKSVCYPSIGGYGFLYPFIGLAGEAGEVMEKAIVYFHIPHNDPEAKEYLRLQLLDEIGDVLWYTMRCSEELGQRFETLLRNGNNKVILRHTNPIYHLCAESIMILNTIKKIFRDNNQILNRRMKYNIVDNLNSILSLILQSVAYLDGDIYELMKENCDKVNKKFVPKEKMI